MSLVLGSTDCVRFRRLRAADNAGRVAFILYEALAVLAVIARLAVPSEKDTEIFSALHIPRERFIVASYATHAVDFTYARMCRSPVTWAREQPCSAVLTHMTFGRACKFPATVLRRFPFPQQHVSISYIISVECERTIGVFLYFAGSKDREGRTIEVCD